MTRRAPGHRCVRCEEREVEAEGDAKGWEAHLVDLDDDGQDEVVFYRSVCAEREFHIAG